MASTVLEVSWVDHLKVRQTCTSVRNPAVVVFYCLRGIGFHKHFGIVLLVTEQTTYELNDLHVPDWLYVYTAEGRWINSVEYLRDKEDQLKAVVKCMRFTKGTVAAKLVNGSKPYTDNTVEGYWNRLPEDVQEKITAHKLLKLL